MKLKNFKIREQLFKRIFQVYDLFAKTKQVLNSLGLFVFSLATLLFLLLFVFDIGYNTHEKLVNSSFGYLLLLLFLSKVLIEFTQLDFKKWITLVIKLLILACAGVIVLVKYYFINNETFTIAPLLISDRSLIACSLLLIITEFHQLSNFFNKLNLSPSTLFAGSFLIIILIGSGLLMLPNATFKPITYFEALFTSVSAVCVTGLVVVDTATVFTPLGKSIILILIQIGGLGIMTFTGLFAYIFSGSASIKERLYLKDVFSGERLSGMFTLLTKIILLTFIIEGIGALFIYYSLDSQWNNKLSLAVFHSISAFCNAGFSIFPDGLANQTVHQNNLLQLTISFLIIFGSIGFPVLFYFYNKIKTTGLNIAIKFSHSKKQVKYYPFVVSQKIALNTTIVLLTLGTVLYYLFEKNFSLAGLEKPQQIIIAFFGSTSARTAGFNIMDISHWQNTTLFLMLFLMWIGASPGSTGGGIKTTTFTLALKIALSYCRGQKKIEIGNRELGAQSIIKVVSIIIISVIIILGATMLLLVFDPGKNPVGLLFESISAFSTVGLSTVNTATLSYNSKIVIVLLMYIGRIGPLLLLTGLLPSNSNNYYKLPVENVSIN